MRPQCKPTCRSDGLGRGLKNALHETRRGRRCTRARYRARLAAETSKSRSRPTGHETFRPFRLFRLPTRRTKRFCMYLSWRRRKRAPKKTLSLGFSASSKLAEALAFVPHCRISDRGLTQADSTRNSCKRMNLSMQQPDVQIGEPADDRSLQGAHLT